MSVDSIQALTPTTSTQIESSKTGEGLIKISPSKGRLILEGGSFERGGGLIELLRYKRVINRQLLENFVVSISYTLYCRSMELYLRK